MTTRKGMVGDLPRTACPTCKGLGSLRADVAVLPTNDRPDLHTRLLAALDERLERARAATPGPWGPFDENGDFELSYGDFGWSCHGPAGGIETEDSEQGKADVCFIAATDPTTEIRRVEALRRVVEAYKEAVAFYNAPENRHIPAGEVQGLLTAIKILAAGEGIEVGDG